MSSPSHRGILLAQSLVTVFLHGKPNRVPTNPKKILVVPAGKLGDVVCTTPVLRALRTQYPQARIIVEDGRNINAALLADGGLADEFINLEEKSISEIRLLKIEVAIFTGPGFDLLARAVVAQIPCVITPRITERWSPYETRPYKILSKFLITTPFAFYGYAPRERLRLLEPLGIKTSDTKKQLGFSENASVNVTKTLAEKGIAAADNFVCIAPGAGNKIKQWPPARFAELAEYIRTKYALPIVLIGSKADRAETDELLAALPTKEGVIDMVEQVPLDELKVLIAHAYCFIGVDTGPLYIAEAFDVPTIDIVGPVYEHTQPPIGEYNLVVVPEGERGVPQLYIMDTGVPDEPLAIQQVLAITVRQVTDAVDTLMERLKFRYE